MVVNTVALSLTFLVALALIRLQPDHRADVRTILGPNARCSTPCFLGIQPKVTTSDQAVERLNASGWVDTIHRTGSAITWRWSGRQSPLIDDTSPSQMVIAVTQTVAYINVQTRISVSDLWLTYGVPNRGFVAFRRGAMLHLISYPELQFDAAIVTGCPAEHLGFWRSNASVYWGITIASAATDTSYARVWRRNVSC